MSLLENYRGQVREGGMAAARVVPAFDEVEDGQARVGVSREAVPIEQLALEGREEALAEGVVVGVADASHRRRAAGGGTPRAEGERGVRAAVARMINDVGRPALREGNTQPRHNQLGPEMGGHRPADDAPTPRVD